MSKLHVQMMFDSKMFSASCANTHDVTTFEVSEIF